MTKQFTCIGLMGKPRKKDALIIHKEVYLWLIQQGYVVIVEQDLKPLLSFNALSYDSLEEIAQKAQLVIVIGGDGNMLRAARSFVNTNTKIIGINKGNLGFLTEISPNNAIDSIQKVLSGQFIDDARFLLEVDVFNQNGVKKTSGFAVNEVVLHSSKVAHMIEYETYINNKKFYFQKADGVIVSTPTGSTAYSLSAGGPIVTPELDAFIITPMFPHSLSSRPLVVHSDHNIKIKFPYEQECLEISCDSQIKLKVDNTDEILIKKAPYKFNLIHDVNYDYFTNLSSKLGWAKGLY